MAGFGAALNIPGNLDEIGRRDSQRVGHGRSQPHPTQEASLVTLVPLSHLLGPPVAAMKRTYLSEQATASCRP